MTRFDEMISKVGFEVSNESEFNAYLQHDTCEASITDKSGYFTITIYYGYCSGKINAKIIKTNGTSKWYYDKTEAQMMSIIRQCMEGYDWTKDETKEEEETMETKTTNITLSLTEGTAKFTKLDGTTYTYHIDSKRYAKTTADGKTKRIGKAEYDAAKHEYDLEQEVENLELHPTDEQAELDKEPCRVEVKNDLYVPAVIDENGCVDCRECNVKECVHRNCMRRNPKNVGGLGECPRLDVIPQPEDVDPNDPENAYPDEAQDPELEEIMEETGLEASDAELERNIRNEQKKTSKPRRSKDIAYEGDGVTLTVKQVDFLRELQNTEAYKEDENDMVIEDITITIGGQFENKPMTVGAMISTLCEKHLGTRIKAKVGNRTMTLFGLTPSGKAIMSTIK